MSEASFPATAPRVLVLEIAVPSYYLDDWDEILATNEEFGMDMDTFDIIHEESGMASPDVNLGILVGGKDGHWVEKLKGRIVDAKVVERTPEHELTGDERLDMERS